MFFVGLFSDTEMRFHASVTVSHKMFDHFV